MAMDKKLWLGCGATQLKACGIVRNMQIPAAAATNDNIL